MKKKPVYLAVLITLAMMFGGCQTVSPLKQYATVQEAFITAVETLIEARTQGFISDIEWQEDVYPAIQTGDILLDTYYTQVTRGADTSNTTATIRTILVRLQIFVERFTENE